MSVHFRSNTLPITSPVHSQTMQMPYQSTPNDLELLCDYWDNPSRGPSNICRTIRYVSTNKNALIQKFSLLGLWDGTVYMHVIFDSYHQGSDYIGKVLNASQLTLNGTESYANTPEQLKNLWKLVLRNSNIQAENVKKIDNIVKEGKCEYKDECKPLIYYK